MKKKIRISIIIIGILLVLFNWFNYKIDTVIFEEGEYISFTNFEFNDLYKDLEYGEIMIKTNKGVFYFQDPKAFLFFRGRFYKDVLDYGVPNETILNIKYKNKNGKRVITEYDFNKDDKKSNDYSNKVKLKLANFIDANLIKLNIIGLDDKTNHYKVDISVPQNIEDSNTIVAIKENPYDYDILIKVESKYVLNDDSKLTMLTKQDMEEKYSAYFPLVTGSFQVDNSKLNIDLGNLNFYMITKYNFDSYRLEDFLNEKYNFDKFKEVCLLISKCKVYPIEKINLN